MSRGSRSASVMLQVYEDIATVITAYPIYYLGSNLKLVLVKNVRRES